MKVLNFICDRCKRIVGSQLSNFGEQIETHLLPMGYQEWCKDCIQGFNIGLLESPNKNAIHEKVFGKKHDKYT